MRATALLVFSMCVAHGSTGVLTTAGRIKRSIVQLARGTQNGLAADAATAAQIGALSKLLEEQNLTTPLATSDKIDGKWQLVYTSTKGGSAGKIGPFVGRVEQHFDLARGSYSNFVHLGPAGLDLVTGELKVRPGRRAPRFPRRAAY
jgi:streptogramin lyase